MKYKERLVKTGMKADKIIKNAKIYTAEKDNPLVDKNADRLLAEAAQQGVTVLAVNQRVFQNQVML